MRKPALPLVLSIAPCLAACSSSPKPQYERGWIGGAFADVTREYEPCFTYHRREGVVGMPEKTAGDSGALVTSAKGGSPLAKAGLAEGDLVLSADGTPVEDGVALREHVEAMTPGTKTTLSYWRAGETRTADVVVGRETYESAGTFQVQLPLPLWGWIDLWPFDNGFNVLGLVAVWWDDERNELDTPQNAYRRSLAPGAPIKTRQQESWGVIVAPFGVSKGKRVVRQETLP